MLLGLVLLKIDFSKTWQLIKQCDYMLLLLAAGVQIVSIFWATWIRKEILSLLEQTSYGVMLKAFFVSNYIASFTPANIGGLLGEPWGLYSFSRGLIPMGKSLALVLLSLIAENCRRIVLASLGALLFFSALPKSYIGVILLAITTYVLYSCIIVMLIFPHIKASLFLRSLLTIGGRFATGLFDRVKLSADKVGHHFQQLLRNRWTYVLLVIMVISNIFLETLRLWLVLLAFGIYFDFEMLLIVPSLAYSVTVLPISLGGLGAAEISGIFVFQSFGIAPEIALPAVFMDRFIFTYWIFALGGVFAPFMKIPFLGEGAVEQKTGPD